MEITDSYEPVDKEGELENFDQKHRVTCLDCILSKDELDTTDVGYQPPAPKEAGYISAGETDEGNNNRRRKDRGDRGDRGDRPKK